MKRRRKTEVTVEAVERHLLELEPYGVLTREIVPISIPLDWETARPIPPRLFFFPAHNILVHTYGDDAWYEKHPGYRKGDLSYECYVMDKAPLFLSNYFAMYPTYRTAGVVAEIQDPISIRTLHRPYTKKEMEDKLEREAGMAMRKRSTPRTQKPKLAVVK